MFNNDRYISGQFDPNAVSMSDYARSFNKMYPGNSDALGWTQPARDSLDT